MNIKDQNTDINQYYNYDELDLREIGQLIYSKKLTILIFTLIFTVGSLIHAYTAPIVWQSSSITIPADSSSNSLPIQQSGFAALAGINQAEGDSGPKIIATIKSRDFLEHLLSFDGVLENLMAFDSYDPINRVTKFNDSLFDASKNQWKQNKKPSILQSYAVYSASLEVSSPKLSNFVYLKMNHGSPNFSKSFLDLIIKEINELTRERDIKKSEKSLEYLYAQLEIVQQSDVQIAISQLIESQLKKQMLAKVNTNYALEIVDSPFVPELRFSPQRRNILIIGTILGFFLSLIFIFLQHFKNKYFRNN